MSLKWSKEEFLLSDEISAIDVRELMLFSRKNLAMNRTKEDLEKSIKESICFGIHHNNKLVGFLG